MNDHFPATSHHWASKLTQPKDTVFSQQFVSTEMMRKKDKDVDADSQCNDPNHDYDPHGVAVVAVIPNDPC